MTAHAHKLVHETAVAMAHELYDTLMHDNRWYSRWKKQNPDLGPKALEARFVAKNTAKMLPQARATLAKMLGMSGYDEKTKETIYEALILDKQLQRGRHGRGGRLAPATRVLN